MTSEESATTTTSKGNKQYVVPTSKFSFEQLADIYNQARVDYIVPMPMNAKRMSEYVHNYDISLDGSYVSFNSDDLETGVGMLGLRDQRGWITRLGVLPHRREKGIGQFLMESMIGYAIEQHCSLVQLEVIVGNDPARHLFEKLGFEKTRELMIIRRPPGAPKPNPHFEAFEVSDVEAGEFPELLKKRKDKPSWVEESQSLLNTGKLSGYHVVSPEGEEGWVVFQRSAFQLQHIVFSQAENSELVQAMLYIVHSRNAMQDTKVENVPVSHPLWKAYKASGYVEVFHRTEMVLELED